jgi:hypothetical protein
VARGRDAARAAHRREVAVQGEVAKLRAQLAEERASHRGEVETLKAEVVKLRADARRKAGEIAEGVISSSLAVVAEAQEDVGALEDITKTFAKQRDVMIREACRYISMTTGASPEHALEVVWTWLTGRDLPDGFKSVPDLVEFGISPHGWVALIFRKRVRFNARLARNRDRLRRRGIPIGQVGGGVTMDHAEEWAEDPSAPDHDYWREVVHPEYRRQWARYYKAFTDEELEALQALKEPES